MFSDNADMEPTVTKLRTTASASPIIQMVKDHANEAVQNLVVASNTCCFKQAMLDLREEEDVSEPRSPRFYLTKSCRIDVVNEAEYLTTMTAAHRNLESDGLVADIVFHCATRIPLR